MSQKVIITKLRLEGAAPYLGDDESGCEMFSRNPDVVINWLCDGYRTRFNQLRSTRQKHGKDGELVPLGNKNVVDITNGTARKNYSYLAAIPSMILNAPLQNENTEWFASTKRRKTLIEQHRNPGKMPGFKSRKRDDQTFVCFHNNGKKCYNAIYRKVNKNHGVVIIKGQNPSAHSFDGCRWQLKIHVKISQDIRAYTSIRVNWTQKTLVFVNMPLPVSNLKNTDSIVGIDRGCVRLTNVKRKSIVASVLLLANARQADARQPRNTISAALPSITSVKRPSSTRHMRKLVISKRTSHSRFPRS